MCVPDFLTRTVYFSELDGLQMYMGRGQQKLKNMFSGLLTRTVYFSERERDTYTVRVKKPENKIFKLFDPSHVFQRARACNNIRFGSENRKTKSSSFSTRAVYFSELELAEIYGSGQKSGTQNRQVFDPGRVLQRARTCRNIRFGSKNRKAKSSSFLTRTV